MEKGSLTPPPGGFVVDYRLLYLLDRLAGRRLDWQEAALVSNIPRLEDMGRHLWSDPTFLASLLRTDRRDALETAERLVRDGILLRGTRTYEFPDGGTYGEYVLSPRAAEAVSENRMFHENKTSKP